MPRYTWNCERCDLQFEVTAYMSEASLVPDCPKCGRTKGVTRDFAVDNIYACDGPKTLGALAERNSDKMSHDHRHHLRNKNYDTPRD